MIPLLAGLFFVCLVCEFWNGTSIFGERNGGVFSTPHLSPRTHTPFPSDAFCVYWAKLKTALILWRPNFGTCQMENFIPQGLRRVSWPKSLTLWPSGFYANAECECASGRLCVCGADLLRFAAVFMRTEGPSLSRLANSGSCQLVGWLVGSWFGRTDLAVCVLITAACAVSWIMASDLPAIPPTRFLIMLH